MLDKLITQDTPEPVSRALVLFIEPHLFNNDAFHLLIAGNLYNVLWRKYHRDEYFTKAAPPPPLFGREGGETYRPPPQPIFTAAAGVGPGPTL